MLLWLPGWGNKGTDQGERSGAGEDSSVHAL